MCCREPSHGQHVPGLQILTCRGDSAARPGQEMPPRAACIGVQAGILLTLQGKCTTNIRDGAQRALTEPLVRFQGQTEPLLPKGQDLSKPPHSQHHPECARLSCSSSSWKWDSIHKPGFSIWLVLKEATGCRSDLFLSHFLSLFGMD